MIAAIMGNDEMVNLLLEAGSDPNVTNDKGHTALVSAFDSLKNGLSKSNKLIETLITAGTKVSDNTEEQLTFIKASTKWLFKKMSNGENDEVIKISSYSITQLKDSKSPEVLDKLALIIANLLETSIINDIQINENIKVQIKALSKRHKLTGAYVDMFKIIHGAKYKNQDRNLKGWKEKYNDLDFNGWSFKELRSWAIKQIPNSQKNLISSINFFESQKIKK